MDYTLTARDKKEIKHLRSQNSDPHNLQKSRTIFLDAILAGQAERTSVDTAHACATRKLGFLQREKGRRDSGEEFYFYRGFKISGSFYHLETLFSLPKSQMEYSYLENKKA